MLQLALLLLLASVQGQGNWCYVPPHSDTLFCEIIANPGAIVNLISKHYYPLNDDVSARNRRAPATGGAARTS